MKTKLESYDTLLFESLRLNVVSLIVKITQLMSGLLDILSVLRRLINYEFCAVSAPPLNHNMHLIYIIQVNR